MSTQVRCESADEVLARVRSGEILSRHDAYALMEPTIELVDLMAAADFLTQAHFHNDIGMCSIYPLRVGRCGSDCAFCAQSAHHSCDIDLLSLDDVDIDHLMRCVHDAEDQGVGWFSLVTSGEALSEREFSRFLHIVEHVRSHAAINLCASIGELDEHKAHALKQADIGRYHHNIETAPAYFSSICSSHSYADKVRTIRIAQRAGLEICCGGIISLGESPRDRVDMALALRDLNVTSVPLNILSPIPGTRLQSQETDSAENILRTLAMFRIVLPRQTIRFAGGRERALGTREYEGYKAGVNAVIAGNFLTTTGKSVAREIETLTSLGLTIDPNL